MMFRRLTVPLLAVLALVACAAEAGAQPCLIFVHGKQTDTNTFTSYTAARNYWVSGANDFVKTATKNFATPYYVVGYNGTRPYWDAQAAGVVANAIVNATNGGADGGGHRGSQGADAVCLQSNILCSFIAIFIQSCDDATYWLRSSDDVQVRTFSNAPAKNIYLTGGYKAIFGASACLNGEDDGVVQYASIYACNGSATASYDNTNVCNNANKQEAGGFRNLDASHENHDEERNASNADTRKAIPDGNWTCGGSPCAPNTTVASAMTTAQYITLLY